MDAFRSLMKAGDWDLELPLVIRGMEVSEATLAAPPVGVFDGPPVGSRVLRVSTPITRGADVRLVQLALSRPGIGRRGTHRRRRLNHKCIGWGNIRIKGRRIGIWSSGRERTIPTGGGRVGWTYD